MYYVLNYTHKSKKCQVILIFKLVHKKSPNQLRLGECLFIQPIPLLHQ